MALKLTILIISNKWYFMHDGEKLIGTPMYVNENTSAIVHDGYKVEEFESREDMEARLVELGYEWEEQE